MENVNGHHKVSVKDDLLWGPPNKKIGIIW